MKIFVQAKPKAKQKKIERISKNHFIVAVKEPPTKGYANAAIIKSLAEYFGVSQKNIHLISGYRRKNKIVEIAS